MIVGRGNVQDYLGMTLDFLSKGKFIINMETYLDEVLDDLLKDMDGMTPTPEADHLFKMRDNTDKLDSEKADIFHRITAQLMFVSQRGWKDI